MNKILFLVALLLAATASADDEPVVLIFGDSLSAGYGIESDQSWASLLQSRLQNEGYEHRVINASISGETTEGGAARIGHALERFNPSLIILELGGNDGLRGFPPNVMAENLTTIVETSKQSGADVVLLGIKIPSNYGKRYSTAFERVFANVAAAQEITWHEFFMDGVALDDSLMQSDGIHPNAAAQPVLLENVWPLVSQSLKGTQNK